MRSDDQLDIFRNSDAIMASAFRRAAEVAAIDPHFTPQQQRERAAYYAQEAKRYERTA